VARVDCMQSGALQYQLVMATSGPHRRAETMEAYSGAQKDTS